jgi:AcrR family transcriptional regulator/DNA-binding MarR family transcriptional regulator
MPAEVGARRNALKQQHHQQRRVRGATAVSPRVQVSEMQRARLLAAAVATFSELGYAGASVAHIAGRARVSRRTFYDLFESREDCLLAVLQDARERITADIAQADLTGLVWRERVRGGLCTILSFFDREPVLARVCVVQALQGGPRGLAWREEILGELADVLDQGRRERPRSRECTVLTAEGLVGAAFAIVYARLTPEVSTMPAGWGEASGSVGREGAGSRATYASDRGRRPIVRDRPAQPLVALVGELMSLIVLPYLGSAAARQEQQRALPAPSRGEDSPPQDDALRAVLEQDPLRDVPMRLTYRTARVLQAVAEHPGDSNRHIGEQADIYDQGQISKLLGRLERIGLLINTGVGHTKGEPNAWRLTALGERVTRQLSLSTPLGEDTE